MHLNTCVCIPIRTCMSTAHTHTCTNVHTLKACINKNIYVAICYHSYVTTQFNNVAYCMIHCGICNMWWNLGVTGHEYSCVNVVWWCSITSAKLVVSGASMMSIIFSNFKKFSQYLQSSGIRSAISNSSSRSRHHICEAKKYKYIMLIHSYVLTR